MPEQSNDYRVVVFGAGGVGKSSLVLRFVKGTFRESYIPTIEDTYRQVISCNKNICTLQITDTTGSHQFPAMQRLSISKGHAFILVYSCTSRQSLEELRPIWQVSSSRQVLLLLSTRTPGREGVDFRFVEGLGRGALRPDSVASYRKFCKHERMSFFFFFKDGRN